MILRWLTPAWYVPSVPQLDPRVLQAAGVRGIILDLDNTVVAWDESTPSREVREWIVRLREAGLRACIVSNNFTGRARAIGEMLQVPVVAGAVKPIPWAFRKALAIMGTLAGQTALVGDQLFTDILGGNLLGMRTILVDPLSVREFPTTRVVRAAERLIRGRIMRQLKAREHSRHP